MKILDLANRLSMLPEELLKELTLRGIELEDIYSELDEARVRAILKAKTYYMGGVDLTALFGKEIHDPAEAAELRERIQRRYPLIPLYINHREYWVKVIGFLEQHWALVERIETGVLLHFLNDRGGKFDQIHYEKKQEAENELELNGFVRFEAEGEHDFMDPPREPLMHTGRAEPGTYSSGKLWKKPS